MSENRKIMLNMAQILADLSMARYAITEAEHLTPKAAKYIKGQAEFERGEIYLHDEVWS